MINVELDRDSRFSVTFAQQTKTIPLYGDRMIVECEVWDDTNQFIVKGRAILNPLDQNDPAIGCRKALASAIKDVFTLEERRKFFAQVDPFFHQLQGK